MPSKANKPRNSQPKTKLVVKVEKKKKQRPKGKPKTVHRTTVRTLKTSLPRRNQMTQQVKSSGLTRQAQLVALNTLLPYEAPPIRIREEETSMFTMSTALAKHFNFYDIDTGDLVNKGRVCGIISGGAPVWPDLETSISIVSILDSRIYAIVPSFQDLGKGQLKLQSRTFLNPNQSASGVFEFPLTQPFPPVPNKVRLINGGEAYHLYPDDFFVLSGSSDSYGTRHPCIDFEGRRHIWIDAMSPIAVPQATTVSCQFTAVGIQLPNNAGGGGVAQNGNESTMLFCAHRINGSLEEDSNNISCSFDVGTGPNFSATLTIPVSGYYSFSIIGSLYTVVDSVVNATLTNFRVSVDLDTRISCVSKHLINNQLFPTAGKTPFFATEQTHSGSLLIRNTTPNLSKGGMVYAITPGTDMTWWNATSQANVKSEVGLATNRYEGPLEKGAYGWLKPQVRGFRPCNDISTLQDGSTVSVVRSYVASRKSPVKANHPRGMNIYTISPPSEGGLGSAISPTTLTLISTVQFEYTTTNQTPVVSNRAIEMEHIKMAAQLLAQVDVFTENPLHLPQLMAAIQSLGRGASTFYKSNRASFAPLFGALSAFPNPVVSSLGKAAIGLDQLLYG